MAGMDLSLRRADRGISVFWMILALGAGVFLILAILLATTADNTYEGEYDSAPEIVVDDGETSVSGAGDSEAIGAPEDSTLTSDDVTIPGSGPAGVGENPTQEVEVEVESGAATPVEDGEVVVNEGTDAGATAIDDGAIDEEAGERTTVDENEIVVDPDGTTSPVVPTDSGPEGSDGEPLTQD